MWDLDPVDISRVVRRQRDNRYGLVDLVLFKLSLSLGIDAIDSVATGYIRRLLGARVVAL
jgi:hypothetical protein